MEKENDQGNRLTEVYQGACVGHVVQDLAGGRQPNTLNDKQCFTIQCWMNTLKLELCTLASDH